VAVAVTLAALPPQILEKKLGRFDAFKLMVTCGLPWRLQSMGIGVRVFRVGVAPATKLIAGALRMPVTAVVAMV
jgi:hypothetical protein